MVEGDGVVYRVAQAPGLFRVKVPRAVREELAALVRSRRPTAHQAVAGGRRAKYPGGRAHHGRGWASVVI